MSYLSLSYQQASQQVPNQSKADTQYHSLDSFLAEVERRAFVMAESATRNPDDALDLVQDAMLAFVKNYAQKSQDQWAPLFYRVLQNRIRDWARRGKVRNRWTGWLWSNKDEDEQSDPIQSAPDPKGRSMQALLDQADASEQIVVAVQSLPLRQQQAFLLRVWEGLDVASTATAMECSTGSVKTHLSRALRNLRQQLQGYQL